MIAALIFATVARASEPLDLGPPPEPLCPTMALRELSTPPERLAVAWTGRWRVAPRGYLYVVPTSELAGWVAQQQPAWTGRTLQRLGLRKRNTDPSAKYKVLIYDVEREALCRPVAEADPDEAIAGVLPCGKRLSKPTRGRTGCGMTVDRRRGEPGFTVYAIRHRDAARHGHCAVPLDRYVRQAGR
jgi:hypothetical protein